MNWLADGPDDLKTWLSNGQGRLTSVSAAGAQWPVTLGCADQGASASWLTSLVSALFGAARDEIAASPDRGLRQSLVHGGLGVAERIALMAGVDSAAIVNNALLSVSPVGPSQLEDLGSAVAMAAGTWPGRIVAARGIVADAAAVRRTAARAGGFALPNRVSYVFDMSSGQLPDKINAARDAAQLRKAGLTIVDHEDFSAADVREAHAQYTAVYIARHGGRNPRFTTAFFDAVHARAAADFFGLKQDGVLVAFVALREHGDFISVPLIGYRTDADKKLGLYRQIFALALRAGAERKAAVNFGAGAGHFKKLRGAAAAIEYMILVPPQTTWSGRGLDVVLRASEKPLHRLVPRAISAFGG